MRLQQVRDAVLSLLKKNFLDCIMRRPDNPRPVNRAEFAVIVPGFSSERLNGGSRLRTVELEIWYHAKEQDSPRDEIEDAAEKLESLLFEGFPAGNIRLCPAEELSFSFLTENNNRGFCCQFTVNWLESAKEPDTDRMEDLRLSEF